MSRQNALKHTFLKTSFNDVFDSACADGNLLFRILSEKIFHGSCDELL